MTSSSPRSRRHFGFGFRQDFIYGFCTSSHSQRLVLSSIYDPFTTLSNVLVHESYSIHQASPHRIFVPIYTPHSCSRSHLTRQSTFCFPLWFHVHPRFPLTSFETSITITLIITTSYPTSLYFHSTHSWYIRLLHRSSIYISRFLAWLLVHSSFPVDPSIKFTCTWFHEFISPTPSPFHIHSCTRTLPQILLYEIIKRVPGWGPSHDDLEPKRATAYGLLTLPWESRLSLSFKSGCLPILFIRGRHSLYFTHLRNYLLMRTSVE